MAGSLRLHSRPDSSPERSGRTLTGLVALVAASIALGVALWWLNGPPEVPSSSPDWGRIADVLSGSYLPNEDAIDIATGLGWLALAYLAATLFLRVTSQAMNRAGAGAWWAGAALRLSDLVTLPPVRW